MMYILILRPVGSMLSAEGERGIYGLRIPEGCRRYSRRSGG